MIVAPMISAPMMVVGPMISPDITVLLLEIDIELEVEDASSDEVENGPSSPTGPT